MLRIEDTDRTRLTEESIEVILESRQWLGIGWTRDRIDRRSAWPSIKPVPITYPMGAEAYYRYRPPQELQERREEALRRGESPRYDRRCRDLLYPPAGHKPAVRLKAPLDGHTGFVDLIHGDFTFENSEWMT